MTVTHASRKDTKHEKSRQAHWGRHRTLRKLDRVTVKILSTSKCTVERKASLKRGSTEKATSWWGCAMSPTHVWTGVSGCPQEPFLVWGRALHGFSLYFVALAEVDLLCKPSWVTETLSETLFRFQTHKYLGILRKSLTAGNQVF